MKPIYFLAIFLFALLLQSGHSFVHLEEELAQKQCHHKYAKNKTEYTHAHHKLDQCFVCEFAFSTALKSEAIAFRVVKEAIPVPYSYFHSRQITQAFRGSLFALRGPPSFIV